MSRLVSLHLRYHICDLPSVGHRRTYVGSMCSEMYSYAYKIYRKAQNSSSLREKQTDCHHVLRCIRIERNLKSKPDGIAKIFMSTDPCSLKSRRTILCENNRTKAHSDDLGISMATSRKGMEVNNLYYIQITRKYMKL
jgi:hypothetical protein